MPDGESESWSYDSFGREKLFTDFKGQPEAFKYDDSAAGDGRLAGEYFFAAGTAALDGSGNIRTSSAGQSTVYTYDALGRQQTVTDDSGTTTYSYNLDGMMTQEASPEGTITYGYNSFDQQIETSTNNTDIGYAYDVLGRLATTTVTKLNGNTLSTPLVTMDYYDKDGNKAAEVNPAGVLTSYGYDALNRLISVNESLGTTTIFSQSFTLNSDGLRIGATEMELQLDNSTVATIISTWTYDAMNRLTGESVSNSVDGNFTDTYSYDLDGNQISKVHTTSAGTETTTNTYNGDDQLTQSVDSVAGTTTYVYDANGSLTSATNSGTVVASYTYNVQNELVGATVNGVSSSDVYNDNGDRVEETVNGSSTYYLYDDNNPTGYSQVLESKSSPTGAPGMSYILGLDIIGQANSSGVSYFLTDGEGSTRALTNSSGAVTATFNYDSEGNLLGVTYTPASPPPTVDLYDQQQLDVAIGQYQLRARIYNPQTGEFDEYDPMTHSPGDVLGANPYIYADDDAPDMDDPNGTSAISNALFGTAVHSFLARAFEGFTPIIGGVGLNPGPRLPVNTAKSGALQRWGNRQIRSIALGVTGVGLPNIPPLTMRPDFAEWNRTANTGDLYELKSASLAELLNPGFAAIATAQLGIYRGLLTLFVPTVSWNFGTTWAPGLTIWPTFRAGGMQPGSVLITFDDYAAAPGAIFYDVVDAGDAGEFAAVAAAAGIGAAAGLAAELDAVGAVELAAAVEVPAAAAEEGAELGADVIGRIGLDAFAMAA